jgi:hypothetical protein
MSIDNLKVTYISKYIIVVLELEIPLLEGQYKIIVRKDTTLFSPLREGDIPIYLFHVTNP